MAGLAAPTTAGAGPRVLVRSVRSGVQSQTRSVGVVRPASVLPGDTLVAIVEARLARGDHLRAPAHWTLVGHASSRTDTGALMQSVYVHQADASDPRRFRFRTSSPATVIVTLLVLEGADRTQPVSAISTWSTTRVLSSRDPKVARPGELLVVGYATSELAAHATPRGMRRRVHVSAHGATRLTVTIATRSVRTLSTLPDLHGPGGTAFAFVVAPAGSTVPAESVPSPGTTTPASKTPPPPTTTAPPSTTTTAPPLSGSPLFVDQFSQPDGLITNEYAYYDPGESDAVASPRWQLDSGSLFALGNTGWSGIPDDRVPNAKSTNGTDSAIFRLVTRQSNFADVAVSLRLDNQGLVTTPSTPAVDWDGIHIFLRYQSEFSLYYASINRRDGTAVIKKKVPGGPDNGGTYYELTSYVSHAVPYNTWQSIKATVRTNADGSVTIDLYSGGQLVVEGVDTGIGGPPITSAGRVGIRGDNCNFRFDDFRVDPLG